MRIFLILLTFTVPTISSWASSERAPPSCEAFLAGTFKLRLAGFQKWLPLEIGDLVSLSTDSGKVRGRIDEVYDWGIILGSTGVPWIGIDVANSAITAKQPAPEPFKKIEQELKVAIQIAIPSADSSLPEHLYAVERIKGIAARRISIDSDNLLPMLNLLSLLQYTKFKEALTAALQNGIVVISKDGSRQSWGQQFGFLSPDRIEELKIQLSFPQTLN